MKRFTIPLVLICSLVTMLVADNIAHRIGYAQGMADTPSLDAGVVSSDPVPTNEAISSPVVKDAAAHPTTAPKTVGDTYKKSGVLVAVVLALAILAQVAGSRAKPGSFLDRGKIPMCLAAASSVLTALYLGLAGEVPWSAVIAAMGTAGATLLHPDPPRKETKTS